MVTNAQATDGAGLPDPVFGGGTWANDGNTQAEPSSTPGPQPGSAAPRAPSPQSEAEQPPTPPWQPASPPVAQQVATPPAAWSPGQPMPGQPGGPPPPPQIDAHLLNPEVVRAREATIHAAYQPMWTAAQTDAERNAVNLEYQNRVAALRLSVREAEMQATEYRQQVQMYQATMALLPHLAESRARGLAERYKLDIKEIMFDPQGRPITDPNEMDMNAYYRATAAYQQRVAARGSRDQPVSVGGGAAPSANGSIATMSRDDFLKLRDQARRTNGAVLRSVS
jgi:hypothetical protein